jgi:hypothetical protein
MTRNTNIIFCDVVVAAKPQILVCPERWRKSPAKENTSGGGGEQPGN